MRRDEEKKKKEGGSWVGGHLFKDLQGRSVHVCESANVTSEALHVDAYTALSRGSVTRHWRV